MAEKPDKGGLASTATASMPASFLLIKLLEAASAMFWSMRRGFCCCRPAIDHRRSDVEDRDGGLAAAGSRLFGLFPFLGKLIADSAYQGPVFHRALAGILPDLETEIVKRSDRVKGFVVQPRRWVVERTIAWLNRCRRLAKDWEIFLATATRSPSSSSSPFDSCSE